MMHVLHWYWHRVFEWADGCLAAWHWDRGNLYHDRSEEHAREADRIRDCAREWQPRLWQRGEDPRSDARERRW